MGRTNQVSKAHLSRTLCLQRAGAGGEKEQVRKRCFKLQDVVPASESTWSPCGQRTPKCQMGYRQSSFIFPAKSHPIPGRTNCSQCNQHISLTERKKGTEEERKKGLGVTEKRREGKKWLIERKKGGGRGRKKEGRREEGGRRRGSEEGRRRQEEAGEGRARRQGKRRAYQGEDLRLWVILPTLLKEMPQREYAFPRAAL